jgi:hypothetical protein
MESRTAAAGAMLTQERKKKRDRSPSYPGINLQDAVARAETLYRAEGRHKAPVDVVLGHWGYKAKSGAGLVALAALKKFGLLEDAGSADARQAGLTKTGVAIADRDTSPEEKQRLIREAALLPAIHAELWRDFGEAGMPSDSNMRSKLKSERGFTESGAAEFIAQFRETLAFAKLDGSGSISPDPEDKSVGLEDQIKLTPGSGVQTEERGKSPASGVRTFNVPLSPSESVIVQMPARMDDRSWTLWMAVMAAMKPGIVTEGDGS